MDIVPHVLTCAFHAGIPRTRELCCELLMHSRCSFARPSTHCVGDVPRTCRERGGLGAFSAQISHSRG